MARAAIFLLHAALTLILASAVAVAAPSDESGGQSGEPERGTPLLVKGKTGIWLPRGVSLHDRTRVVVPMATDGSGQALPSEFLTDFTDDVRSTLKAKGLVVSAAPEEGDAPELLLTLTVTQFHAGSALLRWVVPLGGTTACIARATVVEPSTGESIGEIVSWRHVAGGGLFSAGAHKYVPRETARGIADALAGKINE